uniref:Uncharacterized protein n=1 Tax=Candidatus Kentrum sp. SD TaxID=2126332 RepID=A0A451BJK9_9GAMM|nr:MAG: hypothetical protein BECKSD772D_GA0070982_101548 [Candidatus Kentron sp. SD]
MDVLNPMGGIEWRHRNAGGIEEGDRGSCKPWKTVLWPRRLTARARGILEDESPVVYVSAIPVVPGFPISMPRCGRQRRVYRGDPRI